VILVTGGSGFIGSHVVDALREAQFEVRVADRMGPRRTDVEFHRMDLMDAGEVSTAVRDVEAVFHFAAMSDIDRVRESPVETIKQNVLGTAVLLEASRRAGVERFVLASSIYVGNPGGHLYTTSKVASERMCLDFQELFDLPFTILRLATAYGPRSRNADVVSIFVRSALNGKPLRIKGSGLQSRYFTYVTDLGRAAVAALATAGVNQTLVVGNRRSVSVRELAGIVREVFRKSIEIVEEPSAARLSDHLGEDESETRHADEILDWAGEIPVERGVLMYKDWLEGEEGCGVE
jgi:UDP-glucose 4-epimerase